MSTLSYTSNQRLYRDTEMKNFIKKYFLSSASTIKYSLIQLWHTCWFGKSVYIVRQYGHTHRDRRFMIYSDAEALGCNEWGKLVFPGCTWIDDYDSLLLHWLELDETSSLYTTTINYRTVQVRGGAGLVPFSSLLCLSLTSFSINFFLSLFVLLQCVCENCIENGSDVIVCPKFVPWDQLLSTYWKSVQLGISSV